MVLVPFERYRRMAADCPSEQLPYALEDIGQPHTKTPESIQEGGGGDTPNQKEEEKPPYAPTQRKTPPLPHPQPPPGAPDPSSPFSDDLDKERVTASNSWLDRWHPLQPLHDGFAKRKSKNT